MIAILTGAPLWVYFVFSYILYLSISSLQSKKHQIRFQLITPIIFVTSLIIEFYIRQTFEWNIICLAIVFITIGCVFGWFATSKKAIFLQTNEEKNEAIRTQILAPTYFHFFILLPYFIFRYYFGYLEFQESQYFQEIYGLVIVRLSAFIVSGLYLGRFLRLLKLSNNLQ